jgi:signal transduction histidine kinase
MAENLEREKIPEPQKQKEYFGFIVQECRRLSALIENVLDFSRHEQGRKQYEFEATDLTALVQDTARLMRNYGADRQIQVATEIRGEPMPVEADGRALQQVLVNLADNAIKHSPQGATITFGLEYPPASTPPVGCRQGAVRLWVEDHGEGIPAEEQEKIFERFYRRGSELQRETPGVGLGLAIVKYVTEAHGGRTSLRSAVGQGSRFTVELPCNHSPES